MEDKVYIECAVENFSDALKAKQAGADRIELCENLSNGGVTPSYGSIEVCVKVLKLPIAVLIRPRVGDFIYSDYEIDIMLKDIAVCNTLQVSSIVIGALTVNNKINYSLIEKFVKASEVKVFFHRAFDEINFSYLEVSSLAKIGISGILSAGGKGNFFDGMDNLKKTLSECNKYNLKLIAAGGLTVQTLPKAQALLKPYAFHGKNII